MNQSIMARITISGATIQMSRDVPHNTFLMVARKEWAMIAQHMMEDEERHILQQAWLPEAIRYPEGI